MKTKPHMKINLLCFVFGLLLGFFLSSLFLHSFKEREQPLLLIPCAKELQKEVMKAEIQYNKKCDSLKVQGTKLSAELKEI